MDELIIEIRRLVAQLDLNQPTRDSLQWQARYFLNRVLASTQHATRAEMLTPAVNNLRRFWLESVGWCSPLSRDLEKIVTLHMELIHPDQTNK